MILRKIYKLIRLPKNELFSRIEFRLSRPHLRWLKTLYINFRCLPLCQAIKLPIYIYGRIKFRSLGSIKIEVENITRGMIKLGNFDNKSAGPTRICNNGEIVFEGPAYIWEGTLLEIGKDATLIIGSHSLIGENVHIMLRKFCRIGDYARIAFESQIMDSDFHYLFNTNTHTIKNCTKPIIIGKYNWIGNRTSIKKGTITSDYTIVAGPNAMLNKDYTSCSAYCILAGSPAKEIANGYRRIFNVNSQEMITSFYDNTDTDIPFSMEDDIDEFCNANPLP